MPRALARRVEWRVKPRELRRKVLIDTRLRHEAGWGDALILNLSSRGLMARTPAAPRRGTYVELCRGSYRIVARVVWVKDNAFGAQAQDVIPIDALATSGDGSAPAPAPPANDRRLRPGRTVGDRQERNRQWGRRLQFLAVTAFAAGTAAMAFDAIDQALSRPLQLVETGLAGSR
jgi:hypothetical protein